MWYQWCTLSTLNCNFFCSSLLVGAEVKIIISSTYMFKKQPSVVKLETLLINIKNNKGPNTEPWGIPLYTSWNTEKFCWKYTICLRLFKLLENQISSLPPMPYMSSRFSKISLFMESKHLEIYNKQAPINELSFIWSNQSSMTLCRLVCVECIFNYADWSIEMIAWSCRYWMTCLLTKLSIIYQNNCLLIFLAFTYILPDFHQSNSPFDERSGPPFT